MAFQFLQPKPANRVPGVAYYPKTWDAARSVVLTADPTIPRTGPFAVRQAPVAPMVAVQPSAAPALPGIFSGLPANQQHQDRAVVPTLSVPQVYPLNVPTGPGVAPVAVPRSQKVAEATAGAFDDLKQLGDNVGQYLKAVHAQFPEWLKQQQETIAQENAVTGDLYSGAAEARQNALLADYEAKAQAATRKAIADTQNLRSRALLAQGGGASSAIDRAQFAAIADINARAAAQAADRALLSNQWLTNLQQQMAGARAARARLGIGDMTLPISIDTSAFENVLRQLALLSPIEQQNLMSGLVGPGGYVADSLSGLQSAYLQDLHRMDALNQTNFQNQLSLRQPQPQIIVDQPSQNVLRFRALTQYPGPRR